MQAPKQKNNFSTFLTLVNDIDNYSIPDTYKQYMNDSIVTALIQYLVIRIAEHVPDDQQKSFGKLLESNATPEDIDIFLRNVVENYEQVMGELVRCYFARLAQNNNKVNGNDETKNK